MWLHVGLMLITPHPILPYFLGDLDLDLPFNISNLDVGQCRILDAFPVQPVTLPKLIPLSWLQPALAVEAQFGLHLLFWYRCPSGGALLAQSGDSSRFESFGYHVESSAIASYRSDA